MYANTTLPDLTNNYSTSKLWNNSNCTTCSDDTDKYYMDGHADMALFLLKGFLSTVAAVPYIIYIVFTLRYRALLQPKNIFKSNFAFRYENLMKQNIDTDWRK